MDVTASLQVSQDESKDLARILGCTVKDLSKEITPYATAALKELVTMFLGQKVFSRGSDMREYWLLLLIENAFDGRIPDEQHVSRLFQTTAAGSRSLIRAVMSKYQYQLKSVIDKSLKSIVESAKKTGGENTYSVVIKSFNLVEELNLRLEEIDGSLPRITKKQGSVATYEIAPSSYVRLSERLEVQPR